jgi:hypothetical protein
VVASILRFCVLGVVNEEICALSSVQESGVDLAVMLDVRGVYEAGRSGLDVPGQDPVGMLELDGGQLEWTDVLGLPSSSCAEPNLRPKRIEPDGPLGRLHLAGERIPERARWSLGTDEREVGSGMERGLKERDALDVIPVDVAEQDGQSVGRTAQGVAERSHPGPAVEDEAYPLVADLDTGGVAPRVQVFLPTDRNRTPYAPESNFHENS